jgi:hypothetical protein
MTVYRDDARDDAQQVIRELNKEIDLWVSWLNERRIACYDLENLLIAQRENIKLDRLKKKGVDQTELELFKNDILRLIARAIMNTYLESLFLDQNIKKHKSDDLFEA